MTNKCGGCGAESRTPVCGHCQRERAIARLPNRKEAGYRTPKAGSVGSYSQRLMNAAGTTSTAAEIAAQMVDDGAERRFVDVWLMGLSLRHNLEA